MTIYWTQELPTKPGRYLRNNPAAQAVLFADLLDVDNTGKLRNYRCNAGGDSVPIEHQEGFWWFGPIPDVPQYDERVPEEEK